MCVREQYARRCPNCVELILTELSTAVSFDWFLFRIVLFKHFVKCRVHVSYRVPGTRLTLEVVRIRLVQTNEHLFFHFKLWHSNALSQNNTRNA